MPVTTSEWPLSPLAAGQGGRAHDSGDGPARRIDELDFLPQRLFTALGSAGQQAQQAGAAGILDKGENLQPGHLRFGQFEQVTHAGIDETDAVAGIDGEESLVHGEQEPAEALLGGLKLVGLLVEKLLEPLGVLLDTAVEHDQFGHVAYGGEGGGVLALPVEDGGAVEH